MMFICKSNPPIYISHSFLHLSNTILYVCGIHSSSTINIHTLCRGTLTRWAESPSPLMVSDRSTARVGEGLDACQMWKHTHFDVHLQTCWSHNKLHAAALSRVGDLVRSAMEKHHPIRKQMFRLSSEGQRGVRFFNPQLRHILLAEAAALVKMNAIIAAWPALQ